MLRKLRKGRKKKMKLAKEEYEGKMLLKPYSKENPDGVKVAFMGKVPVTIRKVEKLKLPKTGDTLLITFREYPDAALALNMTNKKKLVDLFGDETDEWVKNKVNLTVVSANNPSGKGENAMVDSLRVKSIDWQYGDDEGEEVPEDDDTKQPEEPDAEEEKAAKVKARRSK